MECNPSNLFMDPIDTDPIDTDRLGKRKVRWYYYRRHTGCEEQRRKSDWKFHVCKILYVVYDLWQSWFCFKRIIDREGEDNLSWLLWTMIEHHTFTAVQLHRIGRRRIPDNFWDGRFILFLASSRSRPPIIFQKGRPNYVRLILWSSTRSIVSKILKIQSPRAFRLLTVRKRAPEPQRSQDFMIVISFPSDSLALIVWFW